MKNMIGETKKEILDLIKRNAPACLDNIIEHSNLAMTTVREHVTQLEEDGYIKRNYKKVGVGRPKLEFQLTDKGHELYPNHEHLMIKDIIHFLKERGYDHLLEEFFVSFWQNRIEQAKDFTSTENRQSTSEQLDALENMLVEKGFMASVRRENDEIYIEQCNCPFRDVVSESQLPCQLEEKFLKKILNANIERVSYIPDGDNVCAYRIKNQSG